MNTYRTTAIIVGILYIIGTAAGVLSVVFTNAILTAPDYLGQVAAHAGALRLGAVCVLTMGFALALVPVLMFPVLKKHNEVLAVGYVVFRGGLETVTYIATVIGWLLLIVVSQDYAAAGAPAAAYFQTLGNVLRGIADQPMTVFAFGLGALIFYCILYQSRLIPRWITVWGLIAIGLHLTTGVLIILGLTFPFSTLVGVMNLPILVQEMAMAAWMIAKGFNPAVTAAGENGRGAALS